MNMHQAILGQQKLDWKNVANKIYQLFISILINQKLLPYCY